MSITDRYSPPRTELVDVTEETEGFQPIKLWSIKGRIGRMQYVAYLMIAAQIFSVMIGVASALFGKPAGTNILRLAEILLALFALVMTIQRSHDMGWNGWTSLVAVVIPLAALIWSFKAGDIGENQYGYPSPPNSGVVKLFGLILPVIVVGGAIVIVFVFLSIFRNMFTGM